ncbi:MAG TPA: hypothetical protein VGP76_11785 [Planctomycetaceae bacterium]|jgi:hypothetical protein|nr:hypothetical protein [Planctomycetaceae bacterium]
MATRLTPAKRKAQVLALLESPQISALFERVRLASDPPREPAPRKKSPLPTAIGIGILCTLAWWCFGGLRSGALRATLPGGSHAANPAIGDTCLYRGDFYPNAGLQTLRQLHILKTGATDVAGPGLTSRGVAFPVFANWFTVALDSYYAPLALNLVLCWLCAWFVARTTGVLFGDRAKSLLAAICFSLSIIATSFVGEVGPRLLGLCFCYLWTMLLISKDADDAALGWSGAIGLAALMGLWSLVDISSLAGLVVYAAFAVKRRKPGPVVLAALCWVLLPIVQELVWRRLGFVFEPNADLARVWTALQQHGSRLAGDPLGYLGLLAIECANLIFDENPLTVVICLLGVGLVPHKSKWLLRVCFLAPILVHLVLLPTTPGRGAAVAGNTIVLFVLASYYAVEAGRRLQARFGAEAFAVPLVGLVVLQAAWGYSGVCGWAFPTKALATGALREAGTALPTKFVRFSGSPQELPTVLGGPVRGPRFCGVVKGQTRPPIISVDRVAPYRENWSGLSLVRRLLLAQAPVLIALLIATVCLMRVWPSLGSVVLFASCAAGSLLCGSTTGFTQQSFAPFEGRIAIKNDEKLVGAVRLSPEFLALLEDANGRGEQIEFFVRLQPVQRGVEHPAEFQVAEWSSTETRFTVPAQAFLDAVRARNGRVEFSITAASASKGLLLHSWQATKPNGERSAQLVYADGSHEALGAFPSFEIRVVRPNNDFAFEKLIERYEPSQAASYALVGF